MPHPYVIVGGGAAGDSAIEGIRAHDPDGPILMLSRDNHAPYRRTLLSRDLWSSAETANQLSLHEDNYYRDRGVELLLRHDVVEVEPDSNTLWDDRGNAHRYGKLLLATGVRPRVLDVAGAEHPELHYFRSLEDYLLLRQRLRQIQHVFVIGANFLALDLAAAMRHQGYEVTLLVDQDYPLQDCLPRDLGGAVIDRCREIGIELISNEEIVSVEDQGGRLVGRTRSGNYIVTQSAVVALGNEPNLELAEAAGLEVDMGIAVDAYARTSSPDIYAAGDVTEFPYLALGRPMRVEYWDHAVCHGFTAGENMAGANKPYEHIPMFAGRLFDVTFEAVGDIDSTFETHAAWCHPATEGVVFYLNDDIVRGVLMWNLVGRADWARALIRERRPTTHEEREARVTEMVGGAGVVREG
jgi:NADPH-dependent 2,4-dienoyl-CoA reductase/sulfur reductase-like enzyme